MRVRWLLAILILLSLGIGSQAQAALLFSGGEDIDFTCITGGACTIYTSSPYAYRAAWAREAYAAHGTTNDPPINRFATPTFEANAVIWVHAQYCDGYAGGCVNTTNANVQMLRLMDSGGNPAVVVRGSGTAGQLVISSRSAAGVFTDLVTCPSALPASREQFDLYVNYGTSGEVALYTNGAKVCDYTGDVTNGDGATTLDQVEFSSAQNNNDGLWSEVIIATTDTRAMARFSAYTTGNGNTTGFSGTNVCSAIWNAAVNNDTNYGYSGTANVMHECTVYNTVPPGAYSVVGLVMSARALVGSSGPQHFDFVTRTNSTDYTSSDYAPLPAFSNFGNYIQTVNPATGNPWAVSDFQDPGFNVGEETKP